MLDKWIKKESILKVNFILKALKIDVYILYMYYVFKATDFSETNRI